MRELTVRSRPDVGSDPGDDQRDTDELVGRLPRTSAVDRTASFRQLAEDHLDDAYALAAVILGDRAEAEDATHDAIVKAWHAWPSLRSTDAFAPWFQRILVNSCRDRLRQRKRRAPLDRPHPDPDLDHSLPSREADAFARTAERDAIERALHELNPDERISVVMRYFLDLPVETIAARLNVPSGTVKSRLHRGIDHLRAAYDAAERAPTDEVRR